MIIDTHAYVTGPLGLHDYFRGVFNVSGAAGRNLKTYPISDDELERSLESQLEELERTGTNLQLVGAPPWAIPTRDCRPPLITGIAEQLNDMVASCARLHPDRFVGLGVLPQSPSMSPKAAINEIRRCINELGFVGVRINPDPGEGGWPLPEMGDDYWYPIYEVLVELDVPALIHGGSLRFSREPELGYLCEEESVAGWSLLRSPAVWRNFPNLKLILAHGGGYIPYQYGRARCFRVNETRRGVVSDDWEPFEDTLRRFYFDTALFDQPELELLFRVCGTDRCLFGTDTPMADFGIDSSVDPPLKDVKQLIDDIDWLTDADRSAIFEDNARQVFSQMKLPV